MTDPNESRTIQFSSATLLAKHDARLDLLTTKLTAALQASDATIQSVVNHAIQAKSTCSSNNPRDLLSCAILNTMLLQVKNGNGFSETGGLRLIDATIKLVRDAHVEPKSPITLFEILFASHSRDEIALFVSPLLSRYRSLRDITTPKFSRVDLATIKSIVCCIRRHCSNGSNPLLLGWFQLMLRSALPPWHKTFMLRTMNYAASDGIFTSSSTITNADIEANLNGYQSETTTTKATIATHAASNIDVALYKAFWKAHIAMGDPSLAEEPKQWRDVSACMERVLAAFRAVPVVQEIDALLPPLSSSPSSKDDDDSMNVDTNDNAIKTTTCNSNNNVSKHKINEYNKMKSEEYQSQIPRQLTSPNVLRLQMKDIRIRRQVLLQYAIFLHHLEFVADSKPTDKDNKNSNNQEVLKTREFCKSLFIPHGEGSRLKKQVYDLLNSDNGNKFKRFVTGVLQREQQWIYWKKHTRYSHLEGNKNINVPKVFKRRKFKSKLSNQGRFVKEKRRYDDWLERQNEWKVPPPKERAEPLLERAQAELWSEDVLKMELKEDMEDDEVTDDMKRKNDNKYVWRTLRMLCEKDVRALTNVSQKNGTLNLDILVKENGDTKI